MSHGITHTRMATSHLRAATSDLMIPFRWAGVWRYPGLSGDGVAECGRGVVAVFGGGGEVAADGGGLGVRFRW